MKLISKFHDFYDTCLSLGIDETVFFKRETTNIEIKEQKITRFYRSDDFSNIADRYYCRKDGMYNINGVFLLHFCGKQIPFFEISISVENGYGTREYTSYCYNVKQFEAFVLKYCKREIAEQIHKKERVYKSNKHSISIYENISNWFDRFSITDSVFDLYFEHQAPYILKTKKEIIVNPCLSSYEFYKHLGTFETFQEISMFISGVMGGQVPPMTEISDKIRLEKKGFDSVTSFRNMKRN